MHEIRKIHYYDHVISQDPEEPPERDAVLETSTISDTSTWSVNGKLLGTFTCPELSALAEVVWAHHLGELRDLLREARALPDLAVLAFQVGARDPGPEIRTRIHRLQERIDQTLAHPQTCVPKTPVVGPDGRVPGRVVTQRLIACPECRTAVSTIDHLVADAEKRAEDVHAGPWFCGHCGCGFNLLVRPNAEVMLSLVKERMVKTAVLLRLRDHGEHPLHVVLHDRSTTYLGEPASPEKQEALRYLYEEHLCPESIFRDVTCVIQNGDTDAHGLFEFVGVRARSTDRAKEAHSTAEEVFKSFGVELEVKHDG